MTARARGSKQPVLGWFSTKDGFLEYVRFKKYAGRTGRCMVSYLDRMVGEAGIGSAVDVMRIFTGLTDGQAHQLNKAMRAWFNYLEIAGVAAKGWLDRLRKAIPKDRVGIDLKVPEESEIFADLKEVPAAPLKHQVAYNLLLDSGLRLVEAMRLLNDFQGAQRINGFYRCPIGMFRGSKQAYYAYFTRHTFRLISRLNREVKQITVERFCQLHDWTRPKYLRKFAFDMMIQLDIPESIADFIEGRVPRRIGAKHYMVLRRQADQKYGRYADLYHKVEAESPQLNTPLFCFVSGILELVSSGVVYFRFFQSVAVAEAITTAAPVL